MIFQRSWLLVQPSFRIPPRYATLAWVAALFMAINTLVRIGLVAFENDPTLWQPARLAPTLLVGVLYDVAALSGVLLPFALLALACPAGPIGRRVHAVLASALVAAGLAGMLFVAACEGVFWNEFVSRFNFIAVDYLIYTREVLGNIRQSYPVGLLLAGVAGAAGLLYTLVAARVWRAAGAEAGRVTARLVASAAVLACTGLWAATIGDGPREALGDTLEGQLASNGYYEFVRALRNNDLDYRTFYRVMPDDRAAAVLRKARSADAARATTPDATWKPRHIVLVTLESLGADMVESFGGKAGLTPNLDAMARSGLMFANVYATGLRTVRGLEALTLSLPPTPGHAVPMRRRNKGLPTLGGALREQGYEPLYIYGGYAYFDNMRDFFGGNGYTVIDRTAIPSGEIHHETVWGVADEDLFSQALREIDARAASGAQVFAHVLTTSNHRPFTYPAGRIDIASGSGREGAVKYADWALGEFIREAARRPWFPDTLFVVVADHTSNGRGRIDLPPVNYRIPLVFYAPGRIAPGRVESTASLVDVPPTLLAQVGGASPEGFFGVDMRERGGRHARAFLANYLTVGYLEDGAVVELSPRRGTRVLDAADGRPLARTDARVGRLIEHAVASYQAAADLLKGARP